jgi:hypothetical protein
MNRIAAGLIGGAAAAAAMSAFTHLASGGRTGNPQENTADREAAQPSAPLGLREHYGEASTAALARILAEALGAELTPLQKRLAGHAVHVGYGAKMGALYAMLRGPTNGHDLPFGLVYAMAVWLLCDELLLPLLGLANPPAGQPRLNHLDQAGAHAVYGVTLAAVTQALLNREERHV